MILIIQPGDEHDARLGEVVEFAIAHDVLIVDQRTDPVGNV